MYQVIQEFYSDTPLFEGSKKECRKFLQARVGGRLRKLYGYDWEDERHVYCYCTQTDRQYHIKKVEKSGSK